MYTLLSDKYGMNLEKAKGFCENMAKQAKEVDLDYRFDTMVIANTHDAHRLEKYAQSQGKSNELVEEIMKAYYMDSKDIGDHETLAQLAGKVGLDKEEARKVLSEGRFSEDVKKDIQESKKSGVKSVPYFLFNESFSLSGVQPEEVFLRVLEALSAEKKKVEKIEKRDGEGRKCENGLCKF